ncbi:MAG TPA: PqiC family protein [Casimicrobiaceae bacterium]|jgi:uncharacterized lipoprotein YmbA|nr:PqiC family protein [Casimicrobiaceae bacterium]
MMRLPFVIAASSIALGLAAGCSTPPPSRFYTLAPTATATSQRSSLVIAVGPVTIPSDVDRPEFVVSTGPNEVRLDDFNRWASPLQEGLARAIAENLVAILGTPRVVRFPQTLATEPDYRVVVEVRTFESTPGKSAALDAVWTVRRMKDGRTQTGRTSAREAVPESGFDALAAAHSRGVARLSQDIAAATQALQGAP